MAIRTIADLPQISINDVRDYSLCANICNSLFEISYMSAVEDHSTYQSKYVSYQDLSGMLLDDVIYQDCVFHGVKTLDSIRVLSSTSLTGQINVDRGFSLTNEILINTDEIRATANNIQLTATGTNTSGKIQISAENSLDMRGDSVELVVGSRGMTVYHTSNVDGNKVISLNRTDNQTRLTLKCNTIDLTGTTTFNSQTVFKDESTFNNDMLVNGTATFKQDIRGCALSAKWADLAEMYCSDEDYEPGTLVMFGGSREITIADGRVNAVVTSRPGLVLNSDCGPGLYKGIALAGRTPVKVSGPVKKFDRIYLDLAAPGVASAVENGRPIAVALAASADPGVKLIECATRFIF